MTRGTRTVLTSGVLVAALLLMGAGFPAKQVAPKKWAGSVCGAINTWVSDAKQGAKDFKHSLNKKKNPSVSDVRDELAAYMGDVADATSNAVNKVEDAGAPSTPKGKQAATALADGLKRARTTLRRLQSQAEHISTRHRAAALADLTTLKTHVDTEFSALADSFNVLNRLDPGHKLEKAFRATRACQALAS